MRIVFMGTPEFAVTALQKLVKNNYKVVGVITAPDKVAGRGKKIRMSAVKEYALTQNLTLLQPTNLKNPEFIEELRNLKADIQIVIAFRMLPEVVWNMPPQGTFNLHASLLPQYRGAAPINHVLINGETETGVTTFFLDKEIDTGKIIMQEKCTISSTDNAGSLHDKLMFLGADVIIETLKAVESGTVSVIPQSQLIVSPASLKPAPKIYKQDCELNWNLDSTVILNKIRGLSPYPAAYSYLQTEKNQKTYYLKIFNAEIIEREYPESKPGTIFTDSKTYFHIITANGIISLDEIQLEGKKRMSVVNFLRGFNLTTACSFKTLI
ncbi:MAG: methionyl-tRNA formyltransferase [Bacteroidetes bacterium]|nr:MAG: methionyl-tRNA formyltransferase [Bacteroidota bacterium]